MGRGGVEGRVPSLMTAAVEREFPILISFLSSLMCRPWGIRLKRERNEVCINPKGISPWGNFVGRQDEGGDLSI